jgi:hypothetical protein
METTTPFDLNRALQQWRADLAQSPAFRDENLDELETHLRDSMAVLRARDLSVDEAFFVAAKRVGSGAMLVEEFGKMYAVNIWVDRFLWALIIAQIWTVIQILFKTIVSLIHQFHGGMFDAYTKWSSFKTMMLYTVIPIAIAAVVFWQLAYLPKSKVGRFLESLSVRPSAMALLFFFLSAGAQVISEYVSHLAWDPGDMYTTYVWHLLPASALYSGLIFLLARQRLLRKA